MTRDPSVSIVIPVYNEAELLASGVQAVERFLSARPPWTYEIIIVESGSTDGSDRIADELAAMRPNVVVIHEGARRGFGSGVRTGYARARLAWVWLVTVDFPFPLQAFDDAVPLLDTHDAVLSHRAGDERGFRRRVQSAAFNALGRRVLGLPFRSVNSAFKFIRREVVQRLPLEASGWLIDAELLFWLARSGASWTEIRVPFQERTAGQSTVGLGTPLVVLGELLRFRWRVRRGPTILERR